MLSPASLRVCCLAVMAPALTKADRRADCLPVVISEPFCDLKTATPYNRKDKYIEVNLPKLSSKFACLLNNRRKAYIHKTWFRTHLKNNSPGCLKTQCPPSDLHNGEVDAESTKDAWHGTSVTLAVADKVRLKYTMNKNSSQKNMGLARTNASLSLHSMKKVNRITQFAPRDKSNPSTPPDVGENLPDTNSLLEMGGLIQSPPEDVSSSCVSDQLSIPERDVEKLSTPEKDGTLSDACSVTDQFSETGVAVPVACTVSEQLSHSVKDVSLLIACTDADKCSIMTLSEGVNVPLISEDINLNMPVTLTDPECAAIDSAIETALSCPAGQFNSSQNLIEESCIVPLNPHSTSINTSFESPITDETPSNSYNPLSSSSSKVENTSSQASRLNFENLNFKGSDFDTTTFSNPSDVTKPHSPLPFAQLTMPYLVTKPRERVPKKKEYCECPVDCKALLDENFKDSLNRIMAAVEKAELLVRLSISTYSKKEISEFVKSYQNKLGIPCQSQLKSPVKPGKDTVSTKTELLQHEEAKSLSTANLVEKLKMSGPPEDLLPSQSVLSGGVSAPSSDPALAFSPEDIADVMQTSAELLSSIKKELNYVDPDLTESSDSECELYVQESAVRQKKAAPVNTLKDRATLVCKSSWLIQRIQELENQIQTADCSLQKIASSLGNICFEETPTKSTLTTAGSDVRSDSPCKKPTLTGPVNGYLDKNSIAHIGHKTCSVETSHLSEDQTNVSEPHEQCSRTKALNVSTFQKRDILATTGLHLKNSKLAKLSTLGCYCSCSDDVVSCVLCMGRYQCVQSIDPYSMPLLDRVSLLDSSFHPLLSYQKDVPLLLHFESILKKTESRYHVEHPVSPPPSIAEFDNGTKPETFSVARPRNRKFNRYATSILSAKYRNKYVRNTKHLRKHGLVFGKWRRYQTKRSLQSRDRFRRISIDSSGSSHDSPVPSPGSLYEESYDSIKKRREENQFDINDVIIPYSNKSARLVDFEFKDIVVPSFRIEGSEICNLVSTDSPDASKDFAQTEESTKEETYLTRHDPLEVDEKKINRRPSVLNIQPNPKRLRREHRLDSRADSSGANTPDPVIFSDQDMFQDQNSMHVPTPPAFSPPPTPSSVVPLSDDSQPSLGSSTMTRLERKKVPPHKRPSEENSRLEVEEIAPYELRSFPLTDEQFEEITFDPYGEDFELTASGPSSPASPGSTTMSTSTIEDLADPEWMVLGNTIAQEPGLKLKLAKR